MPQFDPFDPEEYRDLAARARGYARALGRDESVGEDALQTVLARVVEGDHRPLQGRPYFHTCLIYQIRSMNRRDRRTVSLEERLESPGGAGTRDRRLVLLGLVERKLGAQSEGDERVVHQMRILAEAMGELSEDHQRALKAQIRFWLVRDGGEDAVRAFEKMSGLLLGSFTGTDGLAAAEGRSRGTIAARAHRGLKRLAGLVRAHQEEQSEV